MPRSTVIEARQKRLQNSIGGWNSAAWECPNCRRLISTLRGGCIAHEKACSIHPGSESSAVSAPSTQQAHRKSSTPTAPSYRRRRFFRRPTPQLTLNLELLDGDLEVGGSQNSQAGSSGSAGRQATLSQDQATEWDDWSEVPDRLDEGDVWLRVHPSSSLQNTPGPANFTPARSEPSTPAPPWYPFASLDDFEQASLLILQGATDPHITAQLKLNARRMGIEGRTVMGVPQSAHELHKLLELRASNESLNFEFHDIVSPEFQGKSFKYRVHFRSLWDAVRDLVTDPDLKDHFVYMPEQRFVRSTLSGKVVQAIEEPYHSRGWWNAQLRIGSNGCILYIQLYVDATHLTLSGGAKVWPVYLWLGNLPSSIRKRQGKGGAVLVGYLPVVSYLVYVYHESLKCILQSVENVSRYGKVVRCSDGAIRRVYPLVASISADYEELMKILSLLGHQSGFPCPICLVPRDEQGDLSGTSWEPRTYEGTREVLNRASLAKKPAEAKAIRQEQSLRQTEVCLTAAIIHHYWEINQAKPKSSLLILMGSEYSVYDAVAIVDPLHQLELGVFGRHMWPKLISLLNRKQCATLDQRFVNIPRYPDLDHFNNGVTSLQHIEGNEYGTILRMLAPLIEDLLPSKHNKIVLKTLRTLACIHLLSKLTTHTKETLEMLDEKIVELGEHWEIFSSQFQNKENESDVTVSARFPKLHALAHYVDIIQNKGTSDNYETGLGERQHPQSKTDYDRTNHQPGYESQMLRLYREREIIGRIRGNIERQELASVPEKPNNCGIRVEIGSPQKRALTTTYISSLPYSQHDFQQQLQMFLYENVLGHEVRRMPSARRLPSLQGTHVVPHRLLRVAYVSLVDSRERLDLIRTNTNWRNGGERRDFVVVKDRDDGPLWFARLCELFVLKFQGQEYRIAYIQRFYTRPQRNKLTGYIELQNRNEYAFIFVDSIMRSCVVLTPDAQSSRSVVSDLNDSDMYFRLLQMS
ncbi:hypothetical protein V565_239550 [Rhizoctonia solani 123E]|uniref:Transposase family Tnp2 protein n=1 Tax=Rhizoctonia solani 123E TaxID=1423351 RepID=A0A074RKD6_9AGAM|nr:hypothetical protein V565_239550 [Rhizoctonia solani 123E]